MAKDTLAVQGIKVHNARALRRAIRDAEDKGLRKALRLAYKSLAAVVSARAETFAPVLSGDLKDSIRPLATQGKAVVAAGKGPTRDYAGVIHYGWPLRGIDEQPFIHEGLKREWDNVIEAFDDALSDLADELSTSRTGL